MEGARSILGHMTQEPSRHARAVHRLMEERGLSRNAFAKLAGVSEGALRALNVRNALQSADPGIYGSGSIVLHDISSLRPQDVIG